MHRTRHDLSAGWTFQEAGSSSGEWLPVARVPTQVHIDLLANGIIEDPFVDLNETRAQWVAEKDWVYQASFATPAEGPAGAGGVRTTLVFEGLDTFARVTLNGAELLVSDNMHLSHRVEVTGLLRDQGRDNLVRIEFRSALLRGRELVQAHPEHKFLARQTEEGRLPVRKAQYNWGWDWGPILMTAGPWRPVYLEQFESRVADVWAQYRVDDDLQSCSGVLLARVDGASSGAVRCVLAVRRVDGTVVVEQECAVGPDGMVEVPFRIDAVRLWNPLGYGSQHRYQISATIVRRGIDDDDDDEKLDSMSKMTGFRRSELIQEPDSHGKSFYFRINGVDIFAGGSCWIPADSFLARVSLTKYRDWIKLLVDSNQVMIRVWGGGIYEDEAFLDACDELGILVWHDFAFVCGNYPGFPAFLDSVEAEARQNVRRLRSHPSVVLWAGNNEDYQVQERYRLEYNFEDKDPASWLRSTFPARFIYEDLLPRVLKEEGAPADYHPGSPWGDGAHSTDASVGDIHQWNIWHGQMSRYQDSSQLGGRFVSEFGMEAYPHVHTTRRMVTAHQQQYPGSLAMDFRNKAGDHERRLHTYLCENFRIPHGLHAFTHLTQVLQAEVMRCCYKSWRRMWGTRGQRRCGGALVWQLNDCWPTVSWAVVDYYLVKKPAYYTIRRALRPLDVGIARACPEWTSGHADPEALATAGSRFDLWVSSSCLRDVAVDVEVRMISVRTGRDVRPPVAISGVCARANSTTELLRQQDAIGAVANAAEEGGGVDDPFVMYATLRRHGVVVATDTAWPQPVKYLDFAGRNVSVRRTAASASVDELTVTAELPVMGFVLEEREGMTLSDNGFDVMPGEVHVVEAGGSAALADDDDELGWTYVGAESRGTVQLGPRPRL